MRFSKLYKTSFIFAIILSWFICPSSVLANLPPSVDAGLDQTVTLIDSAFLNGAVTDDGLPSPPGAVSFTWSQLSGPGSVTFDRRDEVLTTATFQATGTYVLRLTVSDGDLTGSDDVSITVATTPPNTIRIPQDYTSIQAGIDAAQPKDLVLVSPGTYVENLYVSKTITLASTFYTTGDDSLIDQTVISSPDSGIETIVVSSDAGAETKIVGFRIRDGKDGIKIRGTARVLNNHLVDLAKDAVDFSNDAVGLVQKNVMENNGDDGIDIDHATVLLRGNLIQANAGDGVEIRTKNNDGPTLAITIRDNVIVANTQDGIQLIDNDTIADTAALLVIDRNLIANNVQAGFGLMDNATSSEDFRAASLLERIHLFNNTFGGNLYGVTGGDNLIAINNIFVDHNNIAMKQVDGNSVLSYNLFWNNGIDEQESNLDISTTLFADPSLDPEYRLRLGSPAIDAGTELFMLPSGEIVLDLSIDEYFGEAPDHGWHEYSGNFPPTIEAGPHQSITLPALIIDLTGTVTDDGNPNPPGVTTSIWTQVSGTPGVDFGNPNDLETTATFPGAGVYTLRLTVSDSELTSTDEVIVTVIDPAVGSVDIWVEASSDDAEEKSSGRIKLTSSDLELVFDGSDQTVGMRFNGVGVPQGAFVTNAYLQFQVDEVNTGMTSLLIEGQAADDPATFTASNGNVSGRPRTVAAVSWTPEPWTTKGEAGPDQQTPDISSIIQEIVDRPGWTSGNSLVIIITGNGERTAESYNGDPTGAPLLHVEFMSNGSNSAPVAADDGPYSTDEDTQLDVAAPGVLGNDTDGDGDPLTAVLDAGPSNGLLTLNADGSFSYAPDAGFRGTDSFTYQANDGSADSNIATVTTTVVAAANNAPVAADDGPYFTDEDTQLDVAAPGVLGNDTDGDGDPLTAVLDAGPSNGLLTLNADGSFSYAPDAGFRGTDSFTYQANDGSADSNNATVTITVTGNIGIEVIDIRVASGSDDAEENARTRMRLTSSDLELVDASSNQTVGMRFSAVGIPQGATIYNAYVQFQADETNSEATSLIIEGENTDNAEAFAAINGSISSRPRTTAYVSWSPEPWLVKGEAGIDQRTPSIASVIQEIVNGSGWSGGNSLVIIITGTGERVAESFDGVQNAAPLLHVEFMANGANQLPVAVDDAFSIDQDSALTGNVLADNGNGADSLGDPPTTVNLGTDVSHGTLSLSDDGSFDYQPNPGFNGSDSFTYTITDAEPETSNTATVAITVNAVEVVQWKLIGPGTRGTLHGPAFHPTNPEIFSIGIDMGLHFITSDGGMAWDILGKYVTSKYEYDGYPGYRGAHETVFDPKDPRIIWAGGTHGLFKSTDGGENWEFLLGGTESYFIGNIELDPTDPNIVYAGSGEPGAGYFQSWVNGSVIYKTVDGGKSWQTINPLGEDQKLGNVWARILIDPNSPFIAGKGHQRILALRHPESKTPGLIISEDHGATWKKENMKLNGDPDSLEINYVTLVSDNQKTILFATMFPTKKGDKIYGGIYRSDDLGKTWLEKNSGLEEAIEIKRTNTLIKIASTPADPNILFCVVHNKVFKSTDQGQSWRQVLYPTGRWHNHILDFDGKYAEYLLQTGEGNWDWSVRGIIGGFHSITMAPSSADYVIITGKFGGVMTTNGGETWFDLGFEYGEKTSVYDLAMKKFGSMMHPSTFTHKRKARSGFQVIVPDAVALDPFNNNIAIAYGDEGLQISRDGGTWWEWAYWGILFREAVDARVVVYDPDVRDRLFLGTIGKVDLQTLGEKEIWKLYQSDDGGVTFKSVGPDFMPSHRFIKDNSKKYNKRKREKITLGIKDMIIDPNTPPDKRTMYVAYSTGAYKSVDGGRTWKEIIQFNAKNIDDVGRDKYYLKFEMNPENSLEIYLATYEGLYRTLDGGQAWEKVFPELFGTIKSLALAKTDGTVIYVVSTRGEGKQHHKYDSHLWKSADAGKTWEKIDEQQTQFVSIHPKDKDIVYRGLYARDIRYEDTGLFRSKNGGKTWEKINSQSPMSFKGGFNHKCQVVFDPKNNQHLYVVTWCGVYEGWDTEVPR